MKKNGGKLIAYNKVKEANLRRLLTIRFLLYDIMEKEKLGR